MLTKRTEAAAQEAGTGGGWGDIIFGGSTPAPGQKKGRQSQGMGDMISKELQRSISRTIATTIKNIVVGSIKGGRR